MSKGETRIIRNLEWQQEDAPSGDWQESVAYAASTGGGWRLPTVDELLSLRDGKRDECVFPEMTGWVYWSSEPWTDEFDGACDVCFENGEDSISSQLELRRVRLVRTVGKGDE